VLLLAQLALVTLATYGLFLYDMSRSRTRLAGRSETIVTPFGVEEYAEFGQGEPVLVIHGAAGGFDQALEMTLPFAGYGYWLIALTLRLSCFGGAGSSVDRRTGRCLHTATRSPPRR
jgi:hypothetical protein